MKKLIGIFAALSMLVSAFSLPVTAANGGKLSVGVDFLSEYLRTGENEYRVFGKNETNETKTVKTVRVLYTNDEIVSLTYGDTFSVAAGAEFAVKEALSVPSDTDLSNSYANVFVWDGSGSYEPYAKQFGQKGVNISFTITEAATTSAGVFDGDTLVRTLWSAVYYEPGTYNFYWDGNDENGTPAQNGNYTVKITSNNVKYEQDALLANNTVREKADTIMSSYRPISDMSLLGENMYYADQYMENYYTLMYFNINDIHRKAGYFEKRGNRVPIRATNDGTTVYWYIVESTPTGQYNPTGTYDTSIYGDRRAFIMGVDVNTNSQVIYENGQSLWDYWGANSATYYKSAIGYEPYTKEEAGHYDTSCEVGYGDIAVQKNGNFLIVTYGSRDFVRVIDKNTGATLKDNALTAPTALAIDPDDNIWVAYKNAEGKYAVSKYSINSDGTLSLLLNMNTSLISDETLSLAVSPDGSYIVMAQGGETNKLFAYNLADFSLRWTYGRGGTYKTDATVYDDKFLFHDILGGRDYTYLEFQGSDYLWVGDPGNDRNRKLYVGGGSAVPTIADTIWFSRQHYPCEIDSNDPTRVFFGAKEFSIDYTKDGDESWTLKKNYMDTVMPYVVEDTSGLFHGITTASNGRTYFAGKTRVNGSQSVSYSESGDKVIYELTENSIRSTKVVVNGWELLTDGSMTLQKAQSGNYNNVSGKVVYRRKFKGFDSSGNPSWYSSRVVAVVPDSAEVNVPSDVAISDTGVLMQVNTNSEKNEFTSNNPRDFRISGFKADTDATKGFLFRTGPATTTNYSRHIFPRDGYVEINAWYGLSGQAIPYGNNFIIHYRGEGLRNGGQSNIFYHYYDNGLLIGVFGVAIRQQSEKEDYGQELTNGNGFCWQMTFPYGKDADTAYIYQGGEARMSGVVRTKVTGLQSIKTQEISITLGSAYRDGILVYSYNAADCGNAAEIGNQIMDSFTLPSDVTNTGSAKYEAYVKAPAGKGGKVKLFAYSDGNVKIEYNHATLIEGSGAIAQDIEISDTNYRKLMVYVTPNNGALSYFEMKADFGKGKDDFPLEYFSADAAKTYVGRTEFDLLEELPFNSDLGTSTLYGWDFSNWNGASCTAKTNVGSYDYDKGSSLTLYGGLYYGDNVWATRDLGNVRYDMSAWDISAEISMEGYPNGFYTYSEDALRRGSIAGEQGKFFDILDVNGKIISRIYLDKDYTLKANGQTLMQTEDAGETISYNYTHELTVPSELKIYATSEGVTFTYRGNSITTPVFESGAIWNKPKTLKVSAFKNSKHGPHASPFSTDFITLKYTQYAMDTPCIVKFYSDDRKTLLGKSVVEKGGAATVPASAKRDGYIVKWDKDITNVQGNMDVYAIYEKDPNAYTVNFYDGDNLVATKSATYGTKLDHTLPAKNGYVFLYWANEDGTQAELKNRQSNMNVYAKWRKLIDASEDFETIKTRISAVTPYMYTDSAKTKIGAISLSNGWIPTEGYVLVDDKGTAPAIPYSGFAGGTGFSNEYIYSRANNGVVNCYAIAPVTALGTDGNNTTVFRFNGQNTMLNYNKFRTYFDGVDNEDMVEVSFDFKIQAYSGTENGATDSVGGFGDLINSSYDGKEFPPKETMPSKTGAVVKARCDKQYGYAIYNSNTKTWVTLLSADDASALEWNNLKYSVNMSAKTVTVYLNGTNKGTFKFACNVDSFDVLEFNLNRNGQNNVYLIDNITVQNNKTAEEE